MGTTTAKNFIKIGLYDPYLDILGGGERFVVTLAHYFSGKYDVDLFWDNKLIKNYIHKRFDIDLNNVNIVPFPKGTFNRTKLLQKFDIFLFVTDGSLFWSPVKKSVLLIQTPNHLPQKKTWMDTQKLATWSKIICYSEFMRVIIKSKLDKDAWVIAPPVETKLFIPQKKENIIVSVGRFFPHLHSKKQEVLIEAFIALYQNGLLPDWELVLIGAITHEPDSQQFLATLQNRAKNFPIRIITNADFSVVKNYYGKAKIFWLATGFRENLELNPEKAEHFGIATVEAMAAGCVPIVFGGGGQIEIVDDKVNGYLFKSWEDLLDYTTEMVTNDNRRKVAAGLARARSKAFSKEVFTKRFNEIIAI